MLMILNAVLLCVKPSGYVWRQIVALKNLSFNQLNPPLDPEILINKSKIEFFDFEISTF